MSSQADSRVAYPGRILLFLANCYLALLLQRGNKHAEAAEYWRRYLAKDGKSEWAGRARRSLKFCEMQVHLSAS